MIDLFRPGLQRGTVDREPGGDMRDGFDFDEAVGPKRRARRYEVHHPAAQAESRRELQRPVELDAFRLDISCRESVS